jgi:hypothetical protein
MTVEEVRAALRSKRLADYYESADRLWAVGGEDTPVTSGRYMNEIAAWSPASDGGFESYTVLFTPVPGRERAMAIAHIRDYAAGGGPRESALNSALVRKYGGYRTAEDVPAAATWRVQIGGEIQTGDSCSRRELFESFAANRDPSAPVANPALKTTPDEFRYQLDHCGVDVVTADHTTANPSAPPAERIATHLTVSAYSPAIAFEGSTAAAGLMQAPERRSPAAAPPGSSPAAPAL